MVARAFCSVNVMAITVGGWVAPTHQRLDNRETRVSLLRRCKGGFLHGHVSSLQALIVACSGKQVQRLTAETALTKVQGELNKIRAYEDGRKEREGEYKSRMDEEHRCTYVRCAVRCMRERIPLLSVRTNHRMPSQQRFRCLMRNLMRMFFV
jgi:hypothetical protein